MHVRFPRPSFANLATALRKPSIGASVRCRCKSFSRCGVWELIPDRLESVRTLIGKLPPIETLKCCDEASPTGYVLYWQLTQMGASGSASGSASGKRPTDAGQAWTQRLPELDSD